MPNNQVSHNKASEEIYLAQEYTLALPLYRIIYNSWKNIKQIKAIEGKDSSTLLHYIW